MRLIYCQNFWQYIKSFNYAFDLLPKVVGTNFGTGSKVLIMVFLALKTFNLVPKVASSFVAHDRKFLN
jgi:hypothetical protein